MTAHCPECAALVDYFGLEPDDRECLAQWHQDHPGWKVSEEEQLAMAAYANEASA